MPATQRGVACTAMVVMLNCRVCQLLLSVVEQHHCSGGALELCPVVVCSTTVCLHLGYRRLTQPVTHGLVGRPSSGAAAQGAHVCVGAWCHARWSGMAANEVARMIGQQGAVRVWCDAWCIHRVRVRRLAKP